MDVADEDLTSDGGRDTTAREQVHEADEDLTSDGGETQHHVNTVVSHTYT